MLLSDPRIRSLGLHSYAGVKEKDNPLLSPTREAWKIEMYKGGKSINMTPELFPFCRSLEECQARAMDRVRQSPEFVKLWRGWRFQFVCFTHGFEVR